MTFDALVEAARTALDRGSWAEAGQWLDRAEAEAKDDAQRALVAMHRASIEVLRGNRSADLRVFRENVVRRFSPRHVALGAYYIIIHALDGRDLTTAERYLPPFLDAVRELDDPLFRLVSQDVLAAIESTRGDHAAAVERARAMLVELDGYDRPDAPLLRTTYTHNLAYTCLAANRFAEALRYAKTSLAFAEQLGRKDILGQVLVTAAFAYLCRDRLEEADRVATRAADVVAGTRLERYAHYVRGETARRRGDLEEAAEHFRRLEAFYPEIPGVAEILLSMNVAPFLLPE